MKNYFVLSVLGASQTNLMESIFKAISDAGCHVEDGRMSRLGNELAFFVMLSGSWDAIAKIEDYLPKLEKQWQINITFRRTTAAPAEPQTMPYAIEVVALNAVGLVYEIMQFFNRRTIGIEDMLSGSYQATHTGAEMFSLQLTINVPSQVSIANLRTEFLEFSDQLNIDSIMEPVK